MVLVEYADSQYRIYGTWNSLNATVSVWWPMRPITDEPWQSGVRYVDQYLAHHLGAGAFKSLDLLDVDLTQPELENQPVGDARHYANSGHLLAQFEPAADGPRAYEPKDALGVAAKAVNFGFANYVLLRSVRERT